MEEILINKLYSYLTENNPDVLIALQDSRKVTTYLEQKVISLRPLIHKMVSSGKPPYIIEEACMSALTEDLRPSRFLYIARALEEDFESLYYRLKENGTLTYEIINLLEDCNLVFDDFQLSEDNEHDRHLRYAITGTISEYYERMAE